jgi:hypothetical protein
MSWLIARIVVFVMLSSLPLPRQRGNGLNANIR